MNSSRNCILFHSPTPQRFQGYSKHSIAFSISRDINDNLSKVPTLVQILQSILRLFKLELAVNHRVDLFLLVQPQHLLEAILRAIQNALECDVPRERKYVGI